MFASLTYIQRFLMFASLTYIQRFLMFASLTYIQRFKLHVYSAFIELQIVWDFTNRALLMFVLIPGQARTLYYRSSTMFNLSMSDFKIKIQMWRVIINYQNVTAFYTKTGNIKQCIWETLNNRLSGWYWYLEIMMWYYEHKEWNLKCSFVFMINDMGNKRTSFNLSISCKHKNIKKSFCLEVISNW